MKRFKDILYFADGITEEGSAFQRAVHLAQANQARLTVLDVLEEPHRFSLLAQRLGTDPHAIIRDRHLAELEALVAPYRSDGNPVSVSLRSGTAFVEVIRAVKQEGFDLVIKPAHPPHGVSERLLGSTDMHLLRKCPCPVWIDKPTSAHPYQSVLAAVDPTAEPDPGTDKLVMDLASSMAERESAQLAVIHAWHLPGESALENGWIQVPPQELEQARAECRQAHEQHLDDLLADYELSHQHPYVYLEKDDVAHAIVRVAEQLRVDLVVMGTVGRTGVPGFIIGNTAENVVQATHASILAVKPQGFVSPVE